MVVLRCWLCFVKTPPLAPYSDVVMVGVPRGFGRGYENGGEGDISLAGMRQSELPVRATWINARGSTR